MLSTSILSNASKCVQATATGIATHNKTTTMHNKDSNSFSHSSTKKLFFYLLLLQLLLPVKNAVVLTATTTEENIRPHIAAHFKPNRSTIVQLFEWKFTDVAEECKSFLGPKGYGGVQLSPVTEHLMYESELVQHPWWERYHPISYEIASRSGNEDDFLAMSRDCNEAGVRIYVDVVLNHMAGGKMTGGEDPLQGYAESEANANTMDYPAVPYDSEDFHKPCNIIDYTDGHAVRNCQVDGRNDLDHSRAKVVERIVELLDKLVDMGVAGFRVDAAKYIWPTDLKKIFVAVKNLSEEFDFDEGSRPLFYQEVVDLGTEAISKTEYSGNGMVTEYLYAAELAIILNGKAPLTSVINWGPVMGFLPHDDCLVFVDSHDSQRNYLRELGRIQFLTYRWASRYIMANAFMLAHPFGGIKRIMSSYHFAADAVDLGPPMTDDDDAVIASPVFDDAGQCTIDSGWVCEHRWPAIANMVELVNSLDDIQDTVINFQSDGPQHISFCRGNKAFIALNNDAELDYVAEVFTCLETGSYCDIISGGVMADGSNCAGKRIVVDAESKTKLSLPAVTSSQSEEENANNGVVENFGVIVIHLGSKLSDEAAAALPPINTEAIEDAEADADGGEGIPSATDVKGEFEMVTLPTQVMAPAPADDGKVVENEANKVKNDVLSKELEALNEKLIEVTEGTAINRMNKDANIDSMRFSTLN